MNSQQIMCTAKFIENSGLMTSEESIIRAETVLPVVVLVDKEWQVQ